MNVDPNEGLSKQQALIKFSKYLQHFRAQGARGNIISYRSLSIAALSAYLKRQLFIRRSLTANTVSSVLCSDALNKDCTQLRVDLQHLKAFSEELGAWLEDNPAEYLPSVSTCSFTFRVPDVCA